MQGVSEPATQKGVIPRAFEHIFESIQVWINLFHANNAMYESCLLRASSSYVCPILSKLCVLREINVIRVFLCACQCAENTKFLVRASYLEIYNEEIRDLLGIDTKQRLEVSCCFKKQIRLHTVQHEKPKRFVLSECNHCKTCFSAYRLQWTRFVHNPVKIAMATLKVVT